MSRIRAVGVVALLAIGGIATAVAAQLNVTSDDLGAGVGVVASCDDSVDVEFSEVEYQQSIGGFAVMEITVSDIDEACEGQYISGGLVNEAGVQIGAALPPGLFADPPGQVTIDGSTMDLAVYRFPTMDAQGVPAEEVTRVGVIITQSNIFGG